MGWVNDKAGGDEGYFVALVKAGASGVPRWRELGYPGDDSDIAHVDAVQVACDCGWRSRVFEAPATAEWRPFTLHVRPEFADEGRALWNAHVTNDHVPNARPPSRRLLIPVRR